MSSRLKGTIIQLFIIIIIIIIVKLLQSMHVYRYIKPKNEKKDASRAFKEQST